MKIILEYTKEDPCAFGPETLYKVIDIEDFDLEPKRKRRPKKRKKVLDVLTEIKETLFDNGDIVIDRDTTIKFY